MGKPQRIFNCESGWSIDLDMVTCIGIPKISDTKVTLKIGMDSNVSKGNKDLFIIHNEDFTAKTKDVFLSCADYLMKNNYQKEWEVAVFKDEELLKKNRSFIDPFYCKVLKTKIKLESMSIVRQYIEHEFKPFHTQLKSAWNEWVNYKESIPSPQICPV